MGQELNEEHKEKFDDIQTHEESPEGYELDYGFELTNTLLCSLLFSIIIFGIFDRIGLPIPLFSILLIAFILFIVLFYLAFIKPLPKGKKWEHGWKHLLQRIQSMVAEALGP